MTRYGLNFGSPDIPDRLRRVFRSRIRVHDCALGSACRMMPKRRGCAFAGLVGCTDSIRMLKTMLDVADNGRRLLHVRFKLVSHTVWYAVYAS